MKGLGMSPDIAVARLALRRLTDEELAALNSRVQQGWADPCLVSGYEKVAHLFAVADGTQTEDFVKAAFADEVLSRPSFQGTLAKASSGAPDTAL
jgi:hypothetical protein